MPKSARTVENWRPSTRRNAWSWPTSWTELHLQKIQNQVIKKATPACPNCWICKSPLYKYSPLTSGAHLAPHYSHLYSSLPWGSLQRASQCLRRLRGRGDRAENGQLRRQRQTAREHERAYTLIPPKSQYLPPGLWWNLLLKTNKVTAVPVERRIFKRKTQKWCRCTTAHDAEGVKPSGSREMLVYLCSDYHITHTEKSRVYW